MTRKICECGHLEVDHADIAPYPCAAKGCRCNRFRRDQDIIIWDRSGMYKLALWHVAGTMVTTVIMIRCFFAPPEEWIKLRPRYVVPYWLASPSFLEGKLQGEGPYDAEVGEATGKPGKGR